MTKITLKELAIRAVDRRCPLAAARIADRCRAEGLTYLETYEWVSSVAPISLASWDSLLYIADAVICC